ncbi:uncharacterized protein M6B38_305745 [Iris pallida]|uniref:Uncharacterized protein n=1 Tax=Iris pallida TaxID=29817 RepID=A0AAX6G255_IRIPA|nr:uncharacterized protein M6B38_387495 [Iris pallida]KAJ6841674.1 uncharacterized protein M6B38_305745 [Iris pallida]
MALPHGNLTAMSRRPGTPCRRTLAAVKGGLRQLDSATAAGRRGLVSSILLSTATLVVPTASDDSKSALLQEYLRRSKENKEKNDKERLDDYYKRNYKDYFEFVEGSDEGKSEEELSESEKGIREWLRKNRK